MKPQPEVSVVMSVHDNAGTLPAALASILSQEGVDLEFIVIDDGSTDASGQILDAEARRDSRLRVVHQANQGLTCALITGCALASAPWIARQDADDLSLPGRLRAQLDRARQADAPVLVACGAECRTPAQERLFHVVPPADPEGVRAMILESGANPGPHGSLFFSRQAYIAAGGYRKPFYYAQDLDLRVRLAACGAVVSIPEILYVYCFSPLSISGYAADTQAAFRRLILAGRRARETGVSESAILAEAESLCLAVRDAGRPVQDPFSGTCFIGACLMRQDPRRAANYFKEALSWRPWSVRARVRLAEARFRILLDPGSRWSGAGDRNSPVRHPERVRGGDVLMNTALNISVVIPSYRRGEVLLQTVRSLLELADPPAEILIADQTEQHPEPVSHALQVLEDAGKIRRIRPPRPSIPVAMNAGLRAARGKMVLFLDDDIIPCPDLMVRHLQAYQRYPEAWAVAGRVVQPEDEEKAESRKQKAEREAEGGSQKTEGRGLKTEDGGQRAEDRYNSHNSGNSWLKYSFLCNLHFPRLPFSICSSSALRRDLDFAFNGTESAWVGNAMAGNLSVRRERFLAVGGFDENFIPPVSYRFETEFARRLIAAGGRIRFAPAAAVRHLRAGTGGTRSLGSHLTSPSPLHGVGDYYFALRCGKGLDRVGYMLRRPFREVLTRFHLRHPWWIPVKFVGELRALRMAVRLCSAGSRPRSTGNEAKAYYDLQYSGSRYAAYAEPAMHPFYTELNGLLNRYGRRNGKWLDVGCGRGLLQDVVADYTGVDVAATVSAFMHKPFHGAPAEALPFEDGVFDGLWSYAVLEHVESPEQALSEMRRVLRTGGILFLSPAWQCRPWAGREYAWKPWRGLSLRDRLLKALIPLRNSVAVRACSVFPRRLVHMMNYVMRRHPLRLYSRPLTPNYAEYNVIDADARHHLDPFDAILWFRSRGDRILSHPGWCRSFFVRTGTLVIEKEIHDTGGKSERGDRLWDIN